MKFQLIIDKAKEEEVVITAHKQSSLTQQIENLVMQHSGTDKLPAYLDDDIFLLSFSEIEYITVLDGKTHAIDKTGKQYALKQRLCEIESLLPGNFIRINKSTIANENRIVRFAATFSGSVDAVFQCGYREYVSRRCFADIKRRYEHL